jgi:phospholipid/cholesterol/gamma-HCH transport system substrate-binding protein
MASKTNIEFKVGILILLGIIILGVSLYWLEGYKLARNSQLIRVKFDDVGTLAIGDKVTVSGVHKGKVEDFDLMDDAVVVQLLISRDVRLKRDAVFTIRNTGVMGERFIAISPGSDSAPLDTAAIADGSYDSGIPEIMGLLGETITELRSLISSFRENVETESTMDKVNITLTNLSKVTTSLADYLDRNEARLDQTTENFLEASKELRRVVAGNAGAIDSSAQRLDRITFGVERLVGQLDTVVAATRSLADAIEVEEGTLQLLLEDRRLYDDLRQTADNLDDLINDIKENPRKYINLKVELF